MASYKLTLVFGAAVALIILIDLATGQGPPIYTNYLQATQAANDYRPPAQVMLPVGAYPHRTNEYDLKSSKKAGDKEFDKSEQEFGAVHHQHQHMHEHSKNFDHDSYEKKDEYSTPAPGVFSSLSNSMSGAWKSISSLGRNKRDTNFDEQKNGTSQVSGSARSFDSSFQEQSQESTNHRNLDNYEYLQYKNQGYIYFKVPKYLVCNY